MEVVTADKPKQRTYSDADKAKALIALDLNKGNVKYTAEQLNIPRITLHSWKEGEYLNDDVLAIRHNKTKDLADKFEDLAHLYIGQAIQTVDKANGTNAITGAGIAVDKMRLLRGESTANIAVLDLASVINHTLQIAVKLHKADHNEPLPTKAEVADSAMQLFAKNNAQYDESLIDFSLLDSVETQQNID